MKYYSNDCVDCGLPCRGSACRYYRVQHFKCDYCKEEDIKLYNYNDDEICEECLIKQFEVVEGSDVWW